MVNLASVPIIVVVTTIVVTKIGIGIRMEILMEGHLR